MAWNRLGWRRGCFTPRAGSQRGLVLRCLAASGVSSTGTGAVVVADERGLRLKLGGLGGQTQSREAVEQGGQGYAGFEAGQGGAQAEVDPVSERQVSAVFAVDVELVGGGIRLRVAAVSAEADQEQVALPDVHVLPEIDVVVRPVGAVEGA